MAKFISALAAIAFIATVGIPTAGAAAAKRTVQVPRCIMWDGQKYCPVRPITNPCAGYSIGEPCNR